VTLQGDAAQSEPTLLDVSGGYGVKVGVSGDLTLANATLLLQNYGQLNFSSAAATLAGSGTGAVRRQQQLQQPARNRQRAAN
jgi:hypothetical protein